MLVGVVKKKKKKRQKGGDRVQLQSGEGGRGFLKTAVGLWLYGEWRWMGSVKGGVDRMFPLFVSASYSFLVLYLN